MNVSTINELKKGLVRNNDIRLTSDIDFQDGSIKHVNKYRGVFDGNGHTIKNFTGKYAFINELKTKIKNTTFKNFTLSGEESSGVICIFNDCGTIQDCTVKDSQVQKNKNAGGICEYNHGEIRNCSVVNNTIKSERSGGLCEYNHGEIRNCSVVNNTIEGEQVGCLCEYNNGKIYQCTVREEDLNTSQAYLICETNSDTINKCIIDVCKYSDRNIVGNNIKGKLDFCVIVGDESNVDTRETVVVVSSLQEAKTLSLI